MSDQPKTPPITLDAEALRPVFMVLELAARSLLDVLATLKTPEAPAEPMTGVTAWPAGLRARLNVQTTKRPKDPVDDDERRAIVADLLAIGERQTANLWAGRWGLDAAAERASGGGSFRAIGLDQLLKDGVLEADGTAAEDLPTLSDPAPAPSFIDPPGMTGIVRDAAGLIVSWNEQGQDEPDIQPFDKDPDQVVGADTMVIHTGDERADLVDYLQAADLLDTPLGQGLLEDLMAVRREDLDASLAEVTAQVEGLAADLVPFTEPDEPADVVATRQQLADALAHVTALQDVFDAAERVTQCVPSQSEAMLALRLLIKETKR